MDYLKAVPLMLRFVDRMNRRSISSTWRSTHPVWTEDLIIHCGRILEQTRPCWAPSSGVFGEPAARIKTASLYLLWRDTLSLYLRRSDLSDEQMVEAVNLELQEGAAQLEPSSDLGTLVVTFLEAVFSQESIILPLISLSRSLGETPESIVYGLSVRSTLSVFRQEMVSRPPSSAIPYRAIDESLKWDDLHFAWAAAERLQITDENFFTLLYGELARCWAALSSQAAASSGQKH